MKQESKEEFSRDEQGFTNCVFGLITNSNDEILLVQLADMYGDQAGNWNLPGGCVDFGESFDEALKREALEESTIVVDNVGGKIDEFFNRDNHIYIFKATASSVDFGKLTSYEIVNAGWFSREKALSLSLAYNIEEYVRTL